MKLDFVVQELRNYPGKGWNLIRTALRTPGIRTRNMGIRALEAWAPDSWPSDAKQLLEQCLATEPDEDVRTLLRTLLARA
jgi:hypothetical protein